MAYSAVISLKQTVQRLTNSSHISVVSSSREILDHADMHLTSLQEVLRRSDDINCNRKRLNPLEEQIMENLHQLEDLLEFHVTDMLASRSPTLPLELDLKEICHEITPKVEAVKKMEKDYAHELENPVFDDDLAANPIQSSTNAPVKMVGLSDTYSGLKDHLMRIIRPDEFGFFSFFGLPGTGRSIVAKTVYDDIYAVGKERSFDCGAWVRIGSTYSLKEILLNIISEIDEDHLLHDSEEADDKLSEYLYSSLEGKRYIIGLDDIRDTEILVELRRSLPEQNNGSLVFVTTGLMEVAEFDDKFCSFILPTILVMNEEFAGRYICSVFFGDDASASQEFEEVARKIAQNCRGLSLVLARVILILRKFKKTLETWSDLAAAEHDRVYMMDDEISEPIMILGSLILVLEYSSLVSVRYTGLGFLFGGKRRWTVPDFCKENPETLKVAERPLQC